MRAIRHLAAAAVAVAAVGRTATQAQVDYVDEGGVRYRVTRQFVPRQIPVQETQSQTQTYLRQQVKTETIQHQQTYAVPVTQYQIVPRLHGRWNPFITPYYTYHYEPVTTWQHQVGTVQIPVTRVTWTPETKTVQVPSTTYRVVNEEILRREPIGLTPSGASPTTMAARAEPSAKLTPRTSPSSAAGAGAPGAPASRVAVGAPPPPPISTAYNVEAGGRALPEDPPRSSWQKPAGDARYPQY